MLAFVDNTETRIRRLALLALATVALGAAPQGQCTQASASPERIVLPGNVIPAHYDVEVTPDAAHLKFRGRARIDIDVQQETRVIELNAADLVFEHVSLAGRAETPQVSLDEQQQTASFAFSAPLAPGHYLLSIEYRGKIYEQASGLFVLDYDGHGNAKKHALFTQFENSDARRFLPCWDEPGRKATFALSAIVKSADSAFSNMPIAASELLGAGLKYV